MCGKDIKIRVIINPQRACARGLLVVTLSVTLSVCVSFFYFGK